MLKRKIYQQLQEWRDSHHEDCLLIKGARQVGKTFAITQFGQTEYESFIAINFIESPQLKALFDGDLSSSNIKKQMTMLIPGIQFIAEKTLIFLDEIQECPNARTALKFLAQDNTIDVIASGSLLGLSYASVSSIPVGYERQIEMYSLDFEEYLWALGYSEETTNTLREHFHALEPLPDEVHKKMLEILHEFMAIGGMPAVVQAFVEKQNFATAYAEQEKILAAYLDDIAKFADVTTRNKARECYLSIPRQLAKENTKFKYGMVEKKGTARKFETALDWLRDANLVRYCRAVTTPQFPLRAYEDESKFRVYLSDPGLLCAMYGFEMIAAIIRDELQGPMKGGIYENVVADMLVKAGRDLHYWMNDKGNIEIEFLLEKEASVVPVEVKAKRGATASLNKLLEQDDMKYGYKLSAGNIGVSGKKITLPLYMALYL
ncbi:MAG: ATP-binding protein [Eggerthellaceae bacterium]|nr:ATP-binding protein [Eggerthellaceae bacterium]